ncbi:hypothetical protein BC936DRAFT_137993 [Jimgerdemannia flammicorona]|uniref:Uncharacterized protein n=2 Tax=Jimgerdemannia flammicorona TaxID=994334 RepID=A0A433CW40_9FUNG|nr:hypothetical protein BC936DRAFT_137993 [Jimgerdemannia flammicorona]RUS30998.1 hypothetical protein BC938DRAFT_478647 [Jimgerdemannia flammicorona]
MKFLFAAATILTVATSALAQNPLAIFSSLNRPDPQFSSYSAECQSAIASFTNNTQLSGCSINELKNSLMNNTDINKNLDQYCAAKCDSNAINSTANSIRTSCAKEIAANDAGGAASLYYLISIWTPLSEAICLKSSDNTYCIVDTVTAINATFSNATIVTAISTSADINSFIAAFPTSLICTACNKNALNILANFIKSSAGIAIFGNNATTELDQLDTALSKKCSVSKFIDGNTQAKSVSSASSLASPAIFTVVVGAVAIATSFVL